MIMATKPHPFDDLTSIMTDRLQKLSYLTQLCAFAAEARRTLNDIQDAATISPDLEKLLGQYVETRSEWTQHPDNLGVVLKYMRHDIDEAIDLINDPELREAVSDR